MEYYYYQRQGKTEPRHTDLSINARPSTEYVPSSRCVMRNILHTGPRVPVLFILGPCRTHNISVGEGSTSIISAEENIVPGFSMQMWFIVWGIDNHWIMVVVSSRFGLYL